MGFVKLVQSQYSEEIDVINVIHYICSLEKCRHLIHGSNQIIGVCPIAAPDSVASQFLTIQRSSRLQYQRRLFHIVYSLDNALDPVCYQAIAAIGVGFSQLYSAYQSVFAVHEDTRNLHLHQVFNNIPVNDDKQLTHSFDLLRLETLADLVLDRCETLKYFRKLVSANVYTIAKDALSVLH